jgi:hypothetical protein
MMCIGMFMAILDVQVVATSLPNIQGALVLPLEPLGLVAADVEPFATPRRSTTITVCLSDNAFAK